MNLDIVSSLMLLVIVGIASALVFFYAHRFLQARTRWVGSPMPYAVSLIGRLADGRVETAIQGVPIQVNLPFKELIEYLRRTLKDAFEAMPSNPARKKKEFGTKILPFLEAKESLKMIPYAIGDDLVVQFNHTAGTLDQYALGSSIDPFKSVGQGGLMPQLIVGGALFPCAKKISIPGGLREAIIGRLPSFLSRRAKPSEDVDLFFFDPFDLSASTIQVVSLSEQQKSVLSVFAEYAGQYASIPVLIHEVERLKDQNVGFEKRKEGDKETIKKQGDEIRELRHVAGGVRPQDPRLYLLGMTVTSMIWLFLGVFMGIGLAFGLGVMSNSFAFGFCIISGVLLGSAGGYVSNYLRVGSKG